MVITKETFMDENSRLFIAKKNDILFRTGIRHLTKYSAAQLHFALQTRKHHSTTTLVYVEQLALLYVCSHNFTCLQVFKKVGSAAAATCTPFLAMFEKGPFLSFDSLLAPLNQ